MSVDEPHFWCDAGLGGLARWLRAAGYESAWDSEIDDADLLKKARESHAIILTSDRGIMERRLITRGQLNALLLPPVGTIQEQLGAVAKRFGLKRREPRCMKCGGTLKSMPKESLRERIPPRTYAWLDEYFVCDACGKLFWRGSHWQRIGRALDHIFDAQEPMTKTGHEAFPEAL